MASCNQSDRAPHPPPQSDGAWLASWQIFDWRPEPRRATRVCDSHLGDHLGKQAPLLVQVGVNGQ